MSFRRAVYISSGALDTHRQEPRRPMGSLTVYEIIGSTRSAMLKNPSQNRTCRVIIFARLYAAATTVFNIRLFLFFCRGLRFRVYFLRMFKWGYASDGNFTLDVLVGSRYFKINI